MTGYTVSRRENRQKVVSIKMSQDLLEKIEFIRSRLGYTSRSDVVRDAVRIYVALYHMIENSIPATYDVKLRDVVEMIEKILRIECGLGLESGVEKREGGQTS